ncbi:MAG: T9SS type A sorting domain-containing protein [Ignavibacteriaceae bacterium]|nr:T9SS type A sorting domain-containing protein [Ignavibacteriaceae bacterium]
MDVFFIDENIGYTVGESGYILKTTNGGSNWFIQSSGTTVILHDVYFIDSSTGYIVGSFGTILKTTNGGNNWISQASGTTKHLWGVHFINSLIGTAVGFTSAILRNTNGGLNWIIQTPTNSGSFTKVYFNDENTGTIVGLEGIILKTTDSGINWILQLSGTENFLNDISYINSSIGTVVGDAGTILKTTTGGNPIPVELFSFKAIRNANDIILNWSTATETNNSVFEILRSTQNDNDEWQKIGFVTGHGTTTETQHYSFTDNDVSPDKYQYKLKQIDYNGTFEYSQIVEVEIPIVNKFSLSQNYPNPFNPVTKIKFTIPTPPISSPFVKGKAKEGFVTLKVYDILGREVATLVNEEKPAGEYEVEFDGSALPSGIYFYQLRARQYSETKKMILLR